MAPARIPTFPERDRTLPDPALGHKQPTMRSQTFTEPCSLHLESHRDVPEGARDMGSCTLAGHESYSSLTLWLETFSNCVAEEQSPPSSALVQRFCVNRTRTSKVVEFKLTVSLYLDRYRQEQDKRRTCELGTNAQFSSHVSCVLLASVRFPV